MNVWLPYISGGSGTDVFTQALAVGLKRRGITAVAYPYAHNYQYAPWLLRKHSAPKGTDLIVTNSWNGFAFNRPGTRMVAIEHHCIFDPAYLPYRSRAQALFHELLVRRFELATFAAADAVVTVSHYTAKSLEQALGVRATGVIHNGIDIEFFSPAPSQADDESDRPVRLLFVGNLSRRKGADLLVPLMERLGSGYVLSYTCGLRGSESLRRLANTRPLGRLTAEALRQAYRSADLLLFPSRLEGFGYAAAEAMACGTPVVTTDCSSLPEIVVDGETGGLCPLDDVDCFVGVIRKLANNSGLMKRMGEQGRNRVHERFSMETMAKCYEELFEGLLGC